VFSGKFEAEGARFLIPENKLVSRLKECSALVFDWDGVFNDGSKAPGMGSNYREADAMGINMLRFGFYLVHGQLPATFIVTGELNEVSEYLAKREHFDAVFYRVKHKEAVIPYLENNHGIKADQAVFLYDDILDLSLAAHCGIRVLVNRTGSSRFHEYAVEQNFCDIVTANSGGSNAIRETSEILLSALAVFQETIRQRSDYSKSYQTYIETRNKTNTRLLLHDGAKFTAINKLDEIS